MLRCASSPVTREVPHGQGFSCAAAGFAVAAVAALAGATPALAADRVVMVDGVARDDASLHVDIVLAVNDGENVRAAGKRALDAHGAKPEPPPPQSSAFTERAVLGNALPVVQSYNAAASPYEAPILRSRNTYGDWSRVPGSGYGISSGGTTSRCPSLVKSARARRATTASMTSAGRGCPTPRSASPGRRAGSTRPTWRSTRATPGARAARAAGQVRPRDGRSARERPRRRARALRRRERRHVSVLPDRALRALGRTTSTGSRRCTDPHDAPPNLRDRGRVLQASGLGARTIAECMPSATRWVGVISTSVKPAASARRGTR